MNLKDALLKAYAEKGQPPPGKQEKARMPIKAYAPPKGVSQPVELSSDTDSGKQRAAGRQQLQSPTGPGQSELWPASVTPPRQALSDKNRLRPSPQAAASPMIRSARPSAAIPAAGSKPAVEVGPNASCLVSSSGGTPLPLLDLDLAFGRRETVNQTANPEVREMAFGFDFGTSSVKVVISDLAADKAYAVPFLQAEGIDAYLLPSRLYESASPSPAGQGALFSLTDGVHAFRDLKLGLLGNPDSLAAQIEAIAFLALVIRRARAWLFQTYKPLYKRVKCLWQLRIGLPAATALNNQYAPLLAKLMRAAWQVAAMDGEPTRGQITKVRYSSFNTQAQDDEPEVQVIPEIAAQIFGFVVSSSFDKKAPNRYLMVDVGAGTVDSSLFKVIPGRGGRWDFEFYTAVVQPYGVSNLHAYRVDWWLSRLASVSAAESLKKELSATKFATDLGLALPARNRDYFEGVHLATASPDQADSEFFDKKLMAQVQGATLWRAWKDGFLAKEQLTGTPMFLCGGGSRSAFYLELEEKLVRLPSYAWLSAEPRQLDLPQDLVVEGVDEADFDRLSVAYGLSKLNVGKITQATPPPKVPSDLPTPFTERYIEKDQT